MLLSVVPVCEDRLNMVDPLTEAKYAWKLYCNHIYLDSDSASVLLYFTFLSHLFSLPCGAGSTVPREGFDSSVIMPFSWCVVAVTLPI